LSKNYLYKYCKIDKFPSSVGIVPVKEFVVRILLFFIQKKKRKKERMLSYDYKFVKAFKFPS